MDLIAVGGKSGPESGLRSSSVCGQLMYSFFEGVTFKVLLKICPWIFFPLNVICCFIKTFSATKPSRLYLSLINTSGETRSREDKINTTWILDHFDAQCHFTGGGWRGGGISAHYGAVNIRPRLDEWHIRAEVSGSGFIVSSVITKQQIFTVLWAKEQPSRPSLPPIGRSPSLLWLAEGDVFSKRPWHAGLDGFQMPRAHQAIIRMISFSKREDTQ